MSLLTEESLIAGNGPSGIVLSYMLSILYTKCEKQVLQYDSAVYMETGLEAHISHPDLLSFVSWCRVYCEGGVTLGLCLVGNH